MLPAQRYVPAFPCNDGYFDDDDDPDLSVRPFLLLFGSVRRNKVDISKLTPAEQQAFRLYGKLPSRPVSKSQVRRCCHLLVFPQHFPHPSALPISSDSRSLAVLARREPAARWVDGWIGG